MDLKHREGKPLSHYSQEERDFVLAPVATEFDADWRLAYGLLNLAELTAPDAIVRLREKFTKLQPVMDTK